MVTSVGAPRQLLRRLREVMAARESAQARDADYEKLERSFMALNHIAAAIIAFRKVRLTVNIIYG